MKEECGSFMAALSVNVVTVNILLSVFFLSDVLAACGMTSHLSITTPKEMEALSGSCLQIPCSFNPSGTTFNSQAEIFGIWIKNESDFRKKENVIFNSSKTDNVYPMEIIGKLNEKNCTTLFSNLTTSHTNTYFFRIESKPYRATSVCDRLQIRVKDSPQRPRIEISGDVKDLKEKESVTITCSAFTPCPHSPPELTWNLQQDSHRQTEENTDGTFTAKFQKNITLSHTHDGYTITCSARYPVDGGKRVNTSETEETLSVSYAPKDTSASISPSGLVSAGSWVKLSCSSRAKPPVSSFTWFKISTEGPVNVSEGPVHSFNATDGGVYYCVAANGLGNQTSQTIRLNVTGYSDGYTAVPWEAVLGGVIGILLFVVCGCICLRKTKAANSNEHQLQNETSKEKAVQELGTKSEQGEEENIHYGEIKFSKQTADPSSASVQDNRQDLETVYAQVKATEPPTRETVENPEALYAQVKTN
ncbi:sialic acid-binding Ig-like lectin 7 [Melanotaenia boesemani]|uniref:sialic acid-binding Ig-like lectin 7 n=1 Tax=Melanotaenia boesemani TaxID=1250792 RepID=UPI001C03CE47|nr:sialic acid-binding Ig-like lectin 7 [Melanotaenia boesemani]